MNVRRHALGPPLRRTGPTRHRKTLSRRRKLLISRDAPNSLTFLRGRSGDSSRRNSVLLDLRGFDRGELDRQIQWRGCQVRFRPTIEAPIFRLGPEIGLRPACLSRPNDSRGARIRATPSRDHDRLGAPSPLRLSPSRKRRSALRVRPVRRSAGTLTGRSSRSPPDHPRRAGDRRAAADPRR